MLCFDLVGVFGCHCSSIAAPASRRFAPFLSRLNRRGCNGTSVPCFEVLAHCWHNELQCRAAATGRVANAGIGEFGSVTFNEFILVFTAASFGNAVYCPSDEATCPLVSKPVHLLRVMPTITLSSLGPNRPVGPEKPSANQLDLDALVGVRISRLNSGLNLPLSLESTAPSTQSSTTLAPHSILLRLSASSMAPNTLL